MAIKMERERVSLPFVAFFVFECTSTCTSMHFSTVDSRLVVLEYGLGLESRLKSVFSGLGLGLGKVCN